ncbi:hypothetical protein Poli38472_003416 [Pythium oligandrum]|uniref:Uncharacterized protein n=1 Tax=Pythium oligandrum TaxID=41045 RepID=A0A8K1C6U2_PYTOL|nr:hypothetical protein Poli38472_003416 [Pythium oligandrum]|eukprot:TMW57491.1 hypothetical protein Poli38472_003416 [Pythium oligandrum]
MLSEDEFVVLIEHAGLVDLVDGSDQEYVERTQLLEWLEREGVELLRGRFIVGENGGAAIEDTDDDNRALARQILDSMIEKEWITAVTEQTDPEGEESLDQLQFYVLRLSTTDAYQIYIDKDTVNMEASFVSTSSLTASESLPDGLKAMRIREKMFKESFPTCSETCKQLYFSFENPVVVLYATLGLNLIGKGTSTVAAFSRELKSMDISHDDRSVIVGFLARAFPSE